MRPDHSDQATIRARLTRINCRALSLGRGHCRSTPVRRATRATISCPPTVSAETMVITT